jgi:hypothetical protein
MEEECWIIYIYSESGPKMIGDGEKLFGDKGKRLQVTVVAVAVVEEFEDTFPTFIR